MDLDESERIRAVADISRLSHRDVESIYDAIRLYSTDPEYITKEEYNQCLRDLVPGSTLSTSDKHMLSTEFSKIFFALDPAEEDKALHRHLICGLSLLCAGSKSVKLAFTYRLFQQGDQGGAAAEGQEPGAGAARGLGEYWLADYLQAFLAALCALVVPPTVPGERVADVVEEVSAEVAALCLEGLQPEDGRVSFEDFGGWYNSGGFEVVPWLELLDLRKWSAPVTDTIKKYFLDDGVELMGEEEDEEEEEEETEREDDDTDVAKLDAAKLAAEGEETEADEAEEDLEGGLEEDEEEDGAAFEFVLDPEGERPLVLTVLPIDVAILQRLAFGTGLGGLSVEEVGGALLRAATADGVLSKRAFDRALRRLVPVEALAARERDRFSTLLATVFLVFDREARMEVDVLEFIAGFVLFCAGSKSVKLAYAFELLDEQSLGYLTRRGVWRFFRSILSMLAALCSSLLDVPTEELQARVDDGAVWTTARAFSYRGPPAAAAAPERERDPNRLSFDDLAAWYTGGGYQVCPWLELLDLRKWHLIPSKDQMERELHGGGLDSTEDGADEEEEEEDEDEEEEDGEEEEEEEGAGDDAGEVVFTFPLCGPGAGESAGEAEGAVLSITAEDIDFIEQVAMSSGFAVRAPEQLLAHFAAAGGGGGGGEGEGEVAKAEFDAAVRALVPERFLTEDDKGLLSFALSNLFFSYDLAQADKAALRDLLCGLSLLCAGTKSAKLAFTFQLYARETDAEGEPVMGPGELLNYLRAVLTAVCACTAQMLELPADRLARLVFDAAAAAVEGIYARPSQRIGFEEFGNWYNNGGFQQIPWLELLDLTKWVPGVASITADLKLLQEREGAGEGEEEEGGGDGEEEEEEEEEGQDEEDEGGEEGEGEVRFHFLLKDAVGPEPPVALALTAADVARVQRLAARTGLRGRDPRAVCGGLLAFAEEGLLSKKQFDRCVRRLIPAQSLTAEEKAEFSALLSALFYAYDRDGSSQVDVLEFMGGFALLCAGNKSGKLAYAFDLLDEDGDGRLSRRGLWRFLRAFLSVLMSMSSKASSMEASELVDLIDNGAVWTAATIFEQCDLAEKNKIDFEELAAWYTEGGYRLSPWLELLDLKKWLYTEQHQQ